MIYSKFLNESKQNHGADLNIKRKARDLRKKMTKTENILWNRLRNRQIKGMYFRRQHPYGIYILDFFCHKANLAIEIDGEIHLSKKIYDTERTHYLEATGIKVIRFRNDEVEENIQRVLNMIGSFLPDND
jgi:very-short-patch-repair endonuclease